MSELFSITDSFFFLSSISVDSSTSLFRRAPILVVSGLSFSIIINIEFAAFNAKSVDPDQAPRSAAPDLGLHCLSVLTLNELTKLCQIVSSRSIYGQSIPYRKDASVIYFLSFYKHSCIECQQWKPRSDCILI